MSVLVLACVLLLVIIDAAGEASQTQVLTLRKHGGENFDILAIYEFN